jgi:hypothetical protein
MVAMRRAFGALSKRAYAHAFRPLPPMLRNPDLLLSPFQTIFVILIADWFRATFHR